MERRVISELLKLDAKLKTNYHVNEHTKRAVYLASSDTSAHSSISTKHLLNTYLVSYFPGSSRRGQSDF